MTKFRLNLRRVAIVFACLAVTMMFAACDNKKGDDDENGDGNGDGGKIDTKLVGTWENMEWRSPTILYVYYYTFDKDGSFKYGSSTNALLEVSGKYSAANGKITFTDISVKFGQNDTEYWNKKVTEYEVKSEDGATILKIPHFEFFRDTDYFENNERIRTYTLKK